MNAGASLALPFYSVQDSRDGGSSFFSCPSSVKPFLKHSKMYLNSDKVDNEDKPLLEHLRLGSFIVDIPMSRRFSV